jgi:biopolymer transport protein ExbB
MLPEFLVLGGLMIWVILVASTVAIVVFIERVLHYHRAQINSMEFLNGVRNVLKRDNVVEAISICDATPGPVARLVKVAIVTRDKGHDRMREALEEAGLIEVPPLEDKLSLLATIAQISPLLGLLGTVLGFIKIFTALQEKATVPTMQDLSGGIWQALICTAAGLAVAIPCYAAYNYLVSRVNGIVLDMEKAATEITNILADTELDKNG